MWFGIKKEEYKLWIKSSVSTVVVHIHTHTHGYSLDDKKAGGDQ